MVGVVSLIMSVNESSPIPLYFQIAQQLEDAIDGGLLAQGQKITSEAELAEQLGVSRPTAHRAYQTLVAKGLLVQHRGSGTHVGPSLHV